MLNSNETLLNWISDSYETVIGIKNIIPPPNSDELWEGYDDNE